MKILLIAGHGESDPGAIGNGYKEADLTREFVAGLIPLLTPFAEVDVYDFNKKLSSRLAKGEKFDFKKYDYVFEVHVNALKQDIGDGKNKGVEILVHPKEKYTIVENEILKRVSNLGFTNRGIKRRTDLTVMNICKGKQGVSYALLEVCFIDDADDMALYNKVKDQYIFAVANGIISGFKLIPKSEYPSIEKIIDFLSIKGVLTNKKLWIEKCKLDVNIEWLLKKTYKALGGELL